VDRNTGRRGKLLDARIASSSLYWRNDERAIYYIEVLARGWTAVNRVRISQAGEAESDPQQLTQVSTETNKGRYITADGRQLIVPRSISEMRIVRLRRSDADSLVVEAIPGTNHVAYGTDMYFTLSPDGRMVAFGKKGVLGVNLFVVPMEGGEPRQLTTSGTIWMFGWSPDSRVLAFATATGDTPAVWFVPVEGGEPTPLVGSVTNGQLWWGTGPLINRLPDASLWVTDSLWVRSGFQKLPFTAENIQRHNAVVEGMSRPLVANDSLGLIFNPVATSPDGRWVVAHWDRTDAPGLWRISLTDSTQSLVSPDSRSVSYRPVGWTRDGSGVFVTQWVGVLDSNEYPVFRVPVGGGEAELVFMRRPAGGYGCETLFENERLSFVCFESRSSSSDAWLIENFDPLAD
jgi:dipeptidyl aminopeptidase/acylaminoacyl peptidase